MEIIRKTSENDVGIEAARYSSIIAFDNVGQTIRPSEEIGNKTLIY